MLQLKKKSFVSQVEKSKLYFLAYICKLKRTLIYSEILVKYDYMVIWLMVIYQITKYIVGYKVLLAWVNMSNSRFDFRF